MMAICRDNRYEIEKQFVALILHKQDIIKQLQIKPKYLGNKNLSKMLEYFIECYKKYGVISHIKIIEAHKDFDCTTFNELYDEIEKNTWYYEKAWKEQLKLSEESILKFYKEDIIIELNKNLEEKKITYDDFISKIRKIGQYKLNEENKTMITINDIDTNLEENYEYIKSKTKLLDEKIKGFILGQLSVWSGGNASAKSTYLNQIAIETINQGHNVAIYSGELIAKRLLKWIVMQCAGKQNMSYNKEKDYWFVNSKAKERILSWLNNRLFIYNNEAGNKANEIINSIRECVVKNNVKVVILDNLMSMNLNSYGDNKYDVQSELIQELSALAKELNIHIHFVCHPRKATTFLRKTDISGSADLTNIADNVFIMHRVNNDFRIKTKEMFRWSEDNKIYEYTNVIEVCKNRELGVEDYFVGMYFEPESKRLLDEKEEKRIYKWVFLT